MVQARGIIEGKSDTYQLSSTEGRHVVSDLTAANVEMFRLSHPESSEETYWLAEASPYDSHF